VFKASKRSKAPMISSGEDENGASNVKPTVTESMSDVTADHSSVEAEEPGVKEPGVKEPGVKEPGVKEPGVKEPGVKEPGVKEPKRVESADSGRTMSSI